MRRQRGGQWGVLALFLGIVVTATVSTAATPSPKRGGILNAMHREDPPSLSIHEEATISTNWPMMACYNNLVLFNPLFGQETVSTIIGELAEKWTWQDGGKALAFTLRQGVKWHDGRPFTSRDVKYTFDMVRGHPINRRPGSIHRHLPADAAAAVAAADVGLRLLPDLPRSYRRSGTAQHVRRHGAVPAQGVSSRRADRDGAESRLLRQRSPLPRWYSFHYYPRTRHAHRRAPGGPARCHHAPRRQQDGG